MLEEDLVDVGFISIDHLPGHNFFLQTRDTLFLMSSLSAGSALRTIRGLKNMLIYAKMRRKYGAFERFPRMRELIKHFQEFNEEKYFRTVEPSLGLREGVAQAFVDSSQLEASLFLLKKHLRLLRQSSSLHAFCQAFLFRFHESFSLEMEGLRPPERQIEAQIAFYSQMLRYKALLRKYRVEDRNFDEFLGQFNLGIFVEMASRIFSEVGQIRQRLLGDFSAELFARENEIGGDEFRPRVTSDPAQGAGSSEKKYFTQSSSKKARAPRSSSKKLRILKAVEHKRKEGLIRADILASAEKLGDIGLGAARQSAAEAGAGQAPLRPGDLVDESSSRAREEIERQIEEKRLLCVYQRILKVTEETLHCSDCNLRVDFGFLAKIINFLNRQLRRFCLQDSRAGVELLSAVLYNVLAFNRVFFRFLEKNSRSDRIERNFFLKYSPDLLRGLAKLGAVAFQEIKVHLEQDLHVVFDRCQSFKALSLRALFSESLVHKLSCCRKLGRFPFELLLNFALHRAVSLYLAKAFASLSLKQDFKFIKGLFEDISQFQALAKREFPARLTELYEDALLNFFSLFESDNYDELLKALLKLNVFLNQNIGALTRHRAALPDPLQEHQHPRRRRGPAHQLLQPVPRPRPRPRPKGARPRPPRQKALHLPLRGRARGAAAEGLSLRGAQAALRVEAGAELGLAEQLAGQPERARAQPGEHPAGDRAERGVLEGGAGLPPGEQALLEVPLPRARLAHRLPGPGGGRGALFVPPGRAAQHRARGRRVHQNGLHFVDRLPGLPHQNREVR